MYFKPSCYFAQDVLVLAYQIAKKKKKKQLRAVSRDPVTLNVGVQGIQIFGPPNYVVCVRRKLKLSPLLTGDWRLAHFGDKFE